jgi:hypothetical protein
MNFDENLAAIHAYLCADGYVIKNPETQKQKYYMIGFRNTNLILLKDFQERFYKYFRINPHLIEGQRCRIGSRELYELLTKEFGSFYSWHWNMPNLNNELTKIWLRAYFDCEGWVTCKSHQNRQLGIDCVNEKGLIQIKEALKGLDIASKIKKRNTRNIHHLSIYGKENIINFRNNIGFLHPAKKEKLDNAIKNFVEYEWKFPSEKEKLIGFIKNILITRGKIRKNSWIIRIISKEENNLITLQKELINLFEIESKVHKSINGIGTVYFELDINKKDNVKKLINLGLLSNEVKEKWLKLQK